MYRPGTLGEIVVLLCDRIGNTESPAHVSSIALPGRLVG
jgi:hypothetical protein